jgi:hypothetical protein
LFGDSFSNPDVIAKVVPNLFSYGKTDDYPYTSIEIVFDNGSKLAAAALP